MQIQAEIAAHYEAVHARKHAADQAHAETRAAQTSTAPPPAGHAEPASDANLGQHVDFDA